jgi:multiple sugar transport system permease protein
MRTHTYRSTQVRIIHALKRTGLYILVFGILAFSLAPILWALISSISLPVELLTVPPHWIPHQPTLKNYITLLHPVARGLELGAYEFNRSILNSFIASGITTVLCLVIGSITAYAYARLEFPGREASFLLIIFTQMLPSVALIIPIYILFYKLKLLDTLIGLILVYSTFTLPFVVWVMKGYFQAIPRELEDAARVDGCGRLGALFRIVLPLSSPGLVATGIFAFLGAWGEFFLTVVLASTTNSKTVTLVLAEFSGVYKADYGLITTAGILASIPPILLALFFGDLLVEGLTAGGVKG